MNPERRSEGRQNIEGLFSLVVSAVIENKAGEILITRRSMERDHRPGEWELVSGRVDAGEQDMVNALAREAKQEVGLELVSAVPFRVFYFERGEDKIPHFGVNFYCRCNDESSVRLDMIEQDGYLWVSPEKALSMIVDPSVIEAVQKYQEFRRNYNI
jgi:8-oxo-dGTP pyrophosphatase MutT (NUDIX family)